MPLKKSALLVIALSVSSVALLVFASTSTPSSSVIPLSIPQKCCSQINESKQSACPWDMVSQIMLRSAA